VINPVGIFGPVLGPDYSTSILIVRRLMDGSIPGCPDLWFGAVDVRDVADLHLKVMTDPAANGQRFLATGGNVVSILQVAQILKENLGDVARKVPARPLPSWLLRVIGLFDLQVRAVLSELGKQHKNASRAFSLYL
jgi:dihydroflavonol-4-reductase